MSNGNCSFCGKLHDEVFRLITSNGCKICNECVGRCCNIISAEYKTAGDELLVLPPAPPNGEERS